MSSRRCKTGHVQYHVTDTAYQCLSGYTEMVLLRRLTTQQKQQAIDVLNSCNPELTNNIIINNNVPWPDNNTIKQWQKMK